MTAVPHARLGPRSPSFGSRAAGSVRSRLVRPGSSSGKVSDSGSRFRPASRGRSRGRESEAQPMVAGVAVNGAAVASGWGSWSLGSESLANLRLVVAGRRVRLGRGAFALASLSALTAILVTLLVLNTALTTDSFQLQRLRVSDGRLAIQEQELLGKLAYAQSPVGLQTKARELGMVPATSPVFLRLSDRAVLGEGDPAAMPPAPAKPKARDKKQDSVTPPVDPAVAGPGGESAAELAVPTGSTGPVVANPALSVPAAPVPAGVPGESPTVGGGGETGHGLVESGR